MNARQVQVNMIMQKTAWSLTHRWLDRCLNILIQTPDKYGYTQNLFPIVQGSTYKDLRKASCEFIASKNATGNAIGGLSVGEPEEIMYEIYRIMLRHFTDKNHVI